jgi:hypothetical protein
MTPEEYLEEVFREAYRHEIDADENVARTLPFFTATLALAASLFGYVTLKLPSLAWTPLSITLYLLLAVGAVGLAGVLWTLFEAVRARQYLILPKESLQSEWTDNLRAFFRDQGLTPKTIDLRVVAELRDQMLVEYAKATEHNRAVNARKLNARAVGLTLLVGVLTIAFLMIAIMFVAERVAPASPQGATHVPSRPAQAAAGAAIQPSAAPAAAGHPGRREVPGRAGGQQGQPVSQSSNSGDALQSSGAPQ